MIDIDVHKANYHNYSKKQLLRINGELQDKTYRLEKALDKACDYLERVNIQDCNVFDEYDDIPDIAYSFDENQWKEQCMKNV